MMTKTITLAIAVALAGCASTNIHINSSPPGGATSATSSAAFQADMSLGTYIGLLFLGQLLYSGYGDDYRTWRPGQLARNPPQLAADSSVVEVDCSRPIALPGANLRCK